MATRKRSEFERLNEAIEEHISQSYGALSSISRVFGPVKVGKNFALVLDPLLRFSLGKDKVIPVNRTRKRKYKYQGTSVYAKITSYNMDSGKGCTVLVPDQPWYSTTTTTSSTSVPGSLADSPDYIKDTSARTRSQGAKYGECELSQFIPQPGGRTTVWDRIITNNSSVIGTAGNQVANSVRRREVKVYPFTGFLSTGDLNALRSSEVAYLNTQVSKQGLRLLSGALPNQRSMSLFRSLVELRDLPRTIRDSMSFLKEQRYWNTNLSKIGGDYLNLEFGILPVVDDLRKLLALVHKLPARVRELNARHGKDSTFHNGYSYTDYGDSTAFSIPIDGLYETQVERKTSNIRKTQLRASVNANVRFPDILPGLPNEYTWLRIAGLDPTISDIYKLIPWTWLIDWFSDLGDYISIVSEFMSDPSVINWGVITARSQLTLETTSVLRHSCQHTRLDGIKTLEQYMTSSDVSVVATGQLITYIRKDASALPKVPCLSTSSNLSSWQLSILGSLLANKFWK